MKRFLLFALCLPLSASAADPDFLGEPACKVINPAAPARARVEWKGACKDGYADGEGVLVMFNGRAADGQFDGRLERGMLVKGYLKSADGTQYDGQFKDGKRDGMGILLDTNGDRYDGPFKNGMRDGHGSQSYMLGGRYDGNWKENRFDGLGSLTYAGGHQVTAQFSRGALVAGGRAIDIAAADTSKAERFVIYSDLPIIGSHFPRVLTSSDVPFDKSYDKLTPAQQARVRAQYRALEDGDEPPYPLRGSAQHFHYINRACEKLNVPLGTLRAVALVDASGHADKVVLLETPDDKLGEVATMMLIDTKFKPAICGGKPCAMAYPLNVDMNRVID